MRAFLSFTLVLTLLFGCQKNEKRIVIATTPVPHAIMLEEVAKPLLAKEGIDLEVIVIEDYYLPNRALAAGDVDANFFQHQLFLDEQNARFGFHLVPLVAVHTEPMGLYRAGPKRPIHTVAIPADPSNKERALRLLSKAGIHPQEILEVDAVLLARSYHEVDLAAIPANYALQMGLDPEKQAVFLEEPDSPYANIVVVRAGDERRLELMALKKVMVSQEMKDFLKEHYPSIICCSS